MLALASSGLKLADCAAAVTYHGYASLPEGVRQPARGHTPACPSPAHRGPAIGARSAELARWVPSAVLFQGETGGSGHVAARRGARAAQLDRDEAAQVESALERRRRRASPGACGSAHSSRPSTSATTSPARTLATTGYSPHRVLYPEDARGHGARQHDREPRAPSLPCGSVGVLAVRRRRCAGAGVGRSCSLTPTGSRRAAMPCRRVRARGRQRHGAATGPALQLHMHCSGGGELPGE